ncbi:MAG: hypothetical protein ACRDQA_15520 [Nocardioidaceae bacterium]
MRHACDRTVRAFSWAWGWLEFHPFLTLAAAWAVTAAMRLPFVRTAMEPDEGGFLMVAGQWHGQGPSLYGSQWVDRPPLLILIFKLASVLGDNAIALRLLALAFGLLTVTAAWWAGALINRGRGAAVGALVAAAVSSNALLDGYALTGEGIAATFVVVSCALTLHCVYRADRRWQQAVLALAAGAVAALAFLVKQNFVDAGLFAVVLLTLRSRTAHRSWPRIGYGAVGLAIPLAAAAWWAHTDGPGVARLWSAIFRFRERAGEVMESSTSAAPQHRFAIIVGIIIVSGLCLLLWQLVVAVRHVEGERALCIALLTMAGYACVSIVLGSNWWRHYLLQLTPVLAMGAALATRPAARRLRPHLVTTVALISALVSTACLAPLELTGRLPGRSDATLAAWVAHASRRNDTIMLAYGSANVIEMAHLSTPYRYAWSLPIRTRDPHLTQYVDTLRGPRAPTWLVEIGDFDWWSLDTPAFQHVRARRYHLAAKVCGHRIYLLNHHSRRLPPRPSSGC